VKPQHDAFDFPGTLPAARSDRQLNERLEWVFAGGVEAGNLRSSRMYARSQDTCLIIGANSNARRHLSSGSLEGFAALDAQV
jgi:hypothetical protein